MRVYGEETMSEIIKDIAIEIGKEVSKEAYADLAKPTVKATGGLLSLIPRYINAKLEPLHCWILAKEYNIEATKKLLEAKLANIDPERIITPEPYIAVPVLQAISYCMDNELLRNMYANLLASSMTLTTKNNVHPSYIEIIKQLSPDEAKILEYLYINQFSPVIYFLYDNINPKTNKSIQEVYSLIGEKAKCEIVDNIQEYFENLDRLKLIEDCPDDFINLPNAHDELMRLPLVIEKMSEAHKYSPIKGITMLTKFGYSFCNVCLSSTK